MNWFTLDIYNFFYVVIAFLLFFGIGLLLYAFGHFIAPPFKKLPGKISSYACGEDIPGGEILFDYNLFMHIAIFFTVLDAVALLVATFAWRGSISIGIVYMLGVVISLFALLEIER